MEVEARLRCIENTTRYACTINVVDAGEILFFPDRVEIADQPNKAFSLDAKKYHTYHIIRDEKSLIVKVKGKERIRTEKLIGPKRLALDMDNGVRIVCLLELAAVQLIV